VVSMAQLKEELWEYDPPSSAVAAVHTYIMQLRRTLRLCGDAHAGEARVVTREHGYMLLTPPSSIDLNVYEVRARSAIVTLEAGATADGAEQIRSAQRLWRGRALVDVQAGPLLRAAVAAIERDRLDLTTRRVGAELRLGRHHELLSELSALVHENPTHEELTAQLMVALYRCGRQAHALDAYHRLRRALREELGAVPGARLSQLNCDILSAHPRLEPPSGAEGRLSLDLAAASTARQRLTIPRGGASRLPPRAQPLGHDRCSRGWECTELPSSLAHAARSRKIE